MLLLFIHYLNETKSANSENLWFLPLKFKAFNSTSRYLDDLLNIDNPYFDKMVGQIYPTELQLNKANSSDTEAPFLDFNLSITNGIVSSKIYDKRDDFNFEIVNFSISWWRYSSLPFLWRIYFSAYSFCKSVI